MPGEEFRAYRRRLPHFRVVDATYHVIWRVHRSQSELSPGEREIVVDALRYFHDVRYTLVAFAAMPDHVHVVVRPTDRSLEQVVHSWKSFVAHRLVPPRTPPIWQREYYDRILTTDAVIAAAVEYVNYNPDERTARLSHRRPIGARGDPG